MSQATVRGVLVIGYGNPLRRDDGIGPHLAAEVESWRLPHVRVVTAHQLAPEMAEDLSLSESAVFLDASVVSDRDGVEVSPLAPGRQAVGMTHHFAPEALLALSQAIYGRAPQAWSVCVMGESFEPGEGLSKIAQQRAAAAAQRLKTLLQRIVPSKEPR